MVNQGEEFVDEMRLLPLRGCDMVLGVQWLREVRPINMDLKALSLIIHYKGKMLELQAKTSKDGQLNFISGESLQKHYSKGNVGVMA